MNAKTKQEVALPDAGGALAAPDFMKGIKGPQSNMDASDIELPRLKLIQALSPELEDGGGIKQGDFYNHVLEQVIGNEITIIPLFVFKAYMLWRPRKDGGGLLARADDGANWNIGQGDFNVKLDGKKPVTWTMAPTVRESGLAEWGSSDPDDPQSQPAATMMYNFVVYLPDFSEQSPIVIPFQKGTMKVGKKLYSKTQLSSVPMFGQKYVLTSEKTENANGDEYWTFKARASGFVQDADMFKKLQALSEKLSTQVIRVAGMDEEDDVAAAEGAGSEASDKIKARI